VTEALRGLGHAPMPVLRAIRAKCLDCSGGMQSEVRDCLVRDCALYPFRMGSNPWRAPATEEQRRSGARVAIAVRNRRNGLGTDATAAKEVAEPILPRPVDL
jgi:hypothetical protein